MVTRRSGFTLIELLVVIAIIAILAAILFPVFLAAKDKGRQAACLSNMKQLSIGFGGYLADYRRFPGGGPLHRPLVGNRKTGEYVYSMSSDSKANYMNIKAGGLYKYVRNLEVYICPSDSHARKLYSGHPFGLSYSMNARLDFVMESAVRRPTKIVVLVDEGAGSVSKADGKTYPICDGFFGDWADSPGVVHLGGCNFAYGDGHVNLRQASQYLELLWDPGKY